MKKQKKKKTIGPSATTKVKKPKKPKLEDLSRIPEKLCLANSDRELCKKCGLCAAAAVGSHFVNPWVPDQWTGKLLVVTPPPVDDGEYVRPLMPRAGRLFRKIAARCGLGPDDVAFAPAVRCSSASVSMTQLRCCRPFLLYVIETLKPAGILGLGKYALKALSNTNNQNITKTRGKPLEVKS